MSNLSQSEIDHFAKDSDYWWDENGPFRPLHRLNPQRLKYIRNQIEAYWPKQTLKKRSVIDIGCGGGLVCEPLARLGMDVTGLDADENAIRVATEHAAENSLKIYYRVGTSDKLQPGRGRKKRYDVVLALEIIEHVPDPAAFVQSCLDLCKPDGLVIFSTLNRTFKSYALGIVAAEKILRWVPEGTHDWRAFIKPSELTRMLMASGGSVQHVCGLIFDPLANEFRLSERDVAVNYFLTASKP